MSRMRQLPSAQGRRNCVALPCIRVFLPTPAATRDNYSCTVAHPGAYSRRVPPWSGARVWWWRIREEVCMERCVRLHRFGVLFSLSLCLYAGNCGSIQAAATATAQPQPSQAVPAPPLPSETRSTQSSPRQQTRPPGYVLTQERYEKSVRYSRASYSLYFAAVLLSLLALV